MSEIIKYKKVLIVLLLNILLLCSFVFCVFCDYRFIKIEAIMLCLFSVLSLNLVIICLFKIIEKEKKDVLLKKIEFKRKTKECLDKMLECYNIVEINKISFGIYHDLANILTALNLSINQIKTEVSDKEIKNLNSNIEESLDISKKAISLASFLKYQYKQKDMGSAFNLSQEIERCLSLFSFYLKKYNIKTNLNLQGNIVLFSKQVRFSQIVINLIGNAIDSLKLKEGLGVKEIKIILIDNLDFINLTIKDNGVGIKNEYLKLIFNPFFSLKNSEGNLHCGLGLFFCKKIVEKDFLGKIKVKSDFGRGAKFVIKIPRQSV